jgi:hypothetical protein
VQTVVLFVSTNRRGDAPEGGWRNNIYTRSLRKIGFIDNRHPKSGPYPKNNEYWIAEVLRENMTANGGCFILKPLRKVGDHVGAEAVALNPNEDLLPLIVGMYEIEVLEGAVIITPHNKALWVMSPTAKKAIMDATPDAHSLVINHGGTLWPRRKPAESVVEKEAKKLLSMTGEPEGEADEPK